MYTPNAVSEYQAFVNDVNDALQKVGSTKSTILLGNMLVDEGVSGVVETWKNTKRLADKCEHAYLHERRS